MAQVRRVFLAIGIALAAVTAALAFTKTPNIKDVALYNHSPSLPVGIYLRVSEQVGASPIKHGAIVTVRARDVAPAKAAARGFAGDGHRFLKRIEALGGDEVCSDGAYLEINGARTFPVRREAGEGERLPAWVGCRRLSAGEVLLLGDTPDSFDGRYWGPIDARLIEGVWRRL